MLLDHPAFITKLSITSHFQESRQGSIIIVGELDFKMAFESSLLKAQIHLKCQLCKQNSKIRWQCLECNLLMCDVCSKDVHNRIAKNHRVVDIKDIDESRPSSSRTTIGMKPSKIVFKVIKERRLQTNSAHHLAFTNDEYLWVGNNTKSTDVVQNRVQKVRVTNEGIELLEEYLTKVFDIAITPSGSTLIVGDGSCLKIINPMTGQVVDSKYNTNQWIPYCVHVTEDNIVIVGAVKEGVGSLLVFDDKGNSLVNYGRDETGKSPLLYFPRKVTTKAGHILVSDVPHDKQNEGKIVIINQTTPNMSVHRYTGHPDINSTENPFKPNDIVSTSSGYVVVMDTHTQNLHILNFEGKGITYYSLKVIGVKRAYSVALSPSGNLFVGNCGNKAKLYELEYSVI